MTINLYTKGIKNDKKTAVYSFQKGKAKTYFHFINVDYRQLF